MYGYITGFIQGMLNPHIIITTAISLYVLYVSHYINLMYNI